MKSFFLTVGLLWLGTMALAQDLQLHNLYWSEGSLGLEEQPAQEGLLAYYPGKDVVFFKPLQTQAIKTYHISTIAWLSYYDNGMHQERQFVKVGTKGHQQEKLHELITIDGLHILRLPLKSNFGLEERSRQYMDRDHRDNRYIYQVAQNTSNHEVRFLEDEQEEKIARYIHYKGLDCYSLEDQREISKFYKKQVDMSFTALSFE